MSLIFNGTTVENLIFNSTEIEKVVFNGTTVWESQIDFITNGVISSGSTISLVDKYCNQGSSTDGTVSISGNVISCEISDYYQASRYLKVQLLFEGISFVGKGQTVTIANTYVNQQIAESSKYDHAYNYAILYAYNTSTGGIAELGNIRYDGTKTFTAPSDGQTYKFYLIMSTWAAKSYDNNKATITITQLSVK